MALLEQRTVSLLSVFKPISRQPSQCAAHAYRFIGINSRRLWNLGFGDWKDGKIDNSVVSNNNDIVRVISTVAKIAYEFSGNFPQRIIQIKPVDEKRKVLYNHIFRRNYATINVNFNINGFKGRKKEKYSPNKIYDRFELNRKFDNEKEQ
ncbi:MAG: hypothetical protein U5L45_19115 [Saprospiraceae bacterium]|nr:hypothetical protein [Saprospiraceae bacterium]